MPPQRPGDPVEGGGDDHDPVDGHADDGPDDVGFRPPLPPEDRIWRHPSELAGARAPAPAPARSDGWRTAALMVLSGAVGATVTVAAVALAGGFDERVVERRVASRSAAIAEAADPVAALAEQTAPSVAVLVVRRDGEESAGSAVVVRSDGYLVTDADVVHGADGVDVVLHGGDAVDGEVVGVDGATGVAVVHVDVDGLRPAVLGTTDALEVGSPAVLVAAAADGGWRASVSSGVVSTLGRRVDGSDGSARYGMLVVDTPVAPAAAGGALVGADGAVVGIASAVRADGAADGSGMATPIELADHVARQLIEHGHVRHVWLGLHGHDLEPSDAAAAGVDGGAHVDDVAAGGPAARAGIEPGDVVVSVDGVATDSMAALIAALRMHLPDDVVSLRVWRDGEVREVAVTLAAKGT